MSNSSTGLAIDGILEPLSLCLDDESAKRILEFRVADAVQDRVAQLATKANEGLLTDEERSEYKALISADELISILKLKARKRFQAETPAF